MKIIADEITPITEEDLKNYTVTGKKMKTPAGKKSVKAEVAKQEAPLNIAPPIDKPKKIYIHIKDPNEHEKLLQMKKLFNEYPGDSEIILMLGGDKQSAIRLPFKADATNGLKGKLVDIYTEKCVVFK